VDDVARLLADLVARPSVNPMGRPLAGPGVLEGAVTDYLEAHFRDLGVRHERVPIAPGRDNLLAYYDAPRPQRTILFDAHQDTVPTDGMTIDPFAARVEAGRLYGRGACDIKGGLAAMLAAFGRLVRERPAGSASVVLACTVDEEYTHLGSSRLAVDRPQVDLAIVAEPTRLDLVNCHKGATRWKIVTRGVACHSSTPQKGVNAIYRMAPVISALARFAGRLAESTPHPVLGPPSLSVGRIEGGTSVNVVPDGCAVEIDRRLIPGEDADAARAAVNAFVAAELGSPDYLEALDPWVRMPALAPENSARWVGPVSAAVATALGRPPAVIGVPFGTDAGPIARSGLPCLVLGPGDIAQAHTEDEWVELDQVRAAVDVYYQIARDLGCD